MHPSQAEPAAPPEESTKSGKGGLLRFVLTVAVLGWLLRSFVVAAFNIPSGSMLPTLYMGDYVMVAKWPYGYSRYSFPFQFPSFEGRIPSILPKRGDVAVFLPEGSDTEFIKRVIGLPGDRVEVRGGMLLLNGQAVRRERITPFSMPVSANSPCRVVPPATPFVTALGPGRVYCTYPAFLETLPGGPTYTVLDQVDNPRADDFGPVQVPAGHVFMMGDNRDDSLDSRYTPAEGGVGLVPLENLVGRALVTFWSTDGTASYWKPWTWFPALRPERLGNGYTGLPE